MVLVDTILTAASNLDGLPTDMAEAFRCALAAGETLAAEYRCEGEYNSQSTHYLYLPGAGRGGVCTGGETEWTDCNGMDDLADRWENYDDCWCN